MTWPTHSRRIDPISRSAKAILRRCRHRSDRDLVWAEMAHDLRAEAIEECGHLTHEEQPDRVNGLLPEFLADWRG
jgi:pimeloyl-ACP methyl ester carboxylesterase